MGTAQGWRWLCWLCCYFLGSRERGPYSTRCLLREGASSNRSTQSILYELLSVLVTVLATVPVPGTSLGGRKRVRQACLHVTATTGRTVPCSGCGARLDSTLPASS
ncbi:hypothetical protein CC78DRAFT_388927 [Lojkania enalia]|uniref:Uncharacterized protein n=1 Tax=Lojkania enalia TaxID=147567 RepID=A0A9P4K2C2_9PLEO|nr:hypothetical protein CC78DRAFT_388927 [Didymosphaeria enalia]